MSMPLAVKLLISFANKKLFLVPGSWFLVPGSWFLGLKSWPEMCLFADHPTMPDSN
jgi:hypothetical protein